jgi:hypothetical protein
MDSYINELQTWRIYIEKSMNEGIKKAGTTLKYVTYNTKHKVVYLHGSHV